MTTTPAPVIALCTLQDVVLAGRLKTAESYDRIGQKIPEVLRRFQLRFGREFMPQVAETRKCDLTSRLVQLTGWDLQPSTDEAPLAVVLHPEIEAITLVEGRDFELDIDPLTGTGWLLELATNVSIGSARARQFGRARIQITGTWGVWKSIEDVAPDVREAAALTVMSAIEKPVIDLSGVDVYTPRPFGPSMGAGWDIPIDAYRKMQIYDRNLGVY